MNDNELKFNVEPVPNLVRYFIGIPRNFIGEKGFTSESGALDLVGDSEMTPDHFL